MKRLPLVVLAAAAPLLSQDPRLVVDLVPGSGSSYPFVLGHSGRPGEVLVAMDDGVRGQELWRTDGTAAGTTLLAEFVPGPTGARFFEAASDSRECWFVLDVGLGRELWRSDGTPAGTTMAFAAASLGATYVGQPQPSARIGSQFLLQVDQSVAVTDGTAAGTQLLGIGWWPPTIVHSDKWYFDDLPRGLTHVVTAGTPATVVTYANTALTTVAGEPVLLQYTSLPIPTVPPTNMLFTTLRAIARPGVPSVGPFLGYLKCFDRNGQCLFVAEGSPFLYRWDLASSLTTIASNVATSPQHSYQYLGDRLMYIGTDPATGTEPWITDGTAAGTQVLDYSPGPASTNVGFGGEIGRTGRALILLDLPATGFEPWSTDGTVAGSQFLGDLEPGPARSGGSTSGFGSAMGQRRTIFAVQTSARGWELWITDGTAAGSRHLQELMPGPADGIGTGVYRPSLVAGHRLLFGADDAVHGVELWAIDLEGSTTPLIAQGSLGFDVNGDAVLGAQVEFRANGMAQQDLGAVAIGRPAVTPLPGPSSTHLFVDLAASLPYLLIAPNAQGAWSQSVAVPNDAALQGLALVAQAGFAGPTIPGGIEFATAWWLCLGR